MIGILALLLVITITVFPGSVLRAILGIPFVLFFPGYTLLAILFPKKNDLSGTTRIALSFVISISMVILIGIILNYSSWGFSLYPLLFTLFTFILLASVGGWIRKRQIDRTEQYTLRINLRLPSIKLPRTRDRIILVIVALSLIGAIGTLVYVVAMPKTGPQFTQFQVLDIDGTTDNYPEEIALGQEASVVVIIGNHERVSSTYRLKVIVDGVEHSVTGLIELGQAEIWQQTVAFTPDQAGDNQKVEFILYKGDEIEPHLSPLHLWINVV